LLAAHPECNVIVSDDGLQHYRLRRTIEIAVFDGRGAGNGLLLPAGPLREPLGRLRAASAVVWNTASPIEARLVRCAQSLPQFTMRLVGREFHALADDTLRCVPEDLRGKRLHAIAGIGDPSRFFGQLSVLGLAFEAHAFPDHHDYTSGDLRFANGDVVLMTEKDAVKCRALYEAGGLAGREAWVLPVEARIDAPDDGTTLLELILEKLDGRALA
jgi:tetraacyldisaccharide 4'-kinase